MQSQIENTEITENPLDSVESVLKSNNWVFDRMSEDQLFVTLTGEANEYSLYFLWEEALGVIQICCQYDTQIPAHKISDATNSIMTLNEATPLGHFTLPKKSAKPTFRYTAAIGTPIGHIIEITLGQCEKYASIFTMLTGANGWEADDLKLALMDTQGRS